jgi:16S rRNA processing protein RimM
VNTAAKRQSAAAHQQTVSGQVGSGEKTRSPEPRFLTVGQVVGVHGVGGELKVALLTQDPHRFGRLERVLVGLEGQEPVPWPLEGYRLHKGHALLKLARCDDRNMAETLRGYLIQVPLEEAIPLEEGEYYEHQILDLDVWTAAGEHLGRVMEIIYTGANEVYVVRGTGPDRRDLLIPATEEVILEVDLEGGRLVVELLEGLL